MIMLKSSENLGLEELSHDVLEEFQLGTLLSSSPLGGTTLPRFAVQTSAGRFVLRFRQPEFAVESFMRFDHDVLLRLARVGLPVPSPMRRRDGTTWMRVEPDTLEVLSWIDGEPFSEGDFASLYNLGACLGRFHLGVGKDVPSGKEGVLREDHPDVLAPYVEDLASLCGGTADHGAVRAIAEQLEMVRHHLDRDLYDRLPHTVIHGDLHPGNVRFRGSDVAAIYDFDYLGLQARVRDVVDALMFFAGRRSHMLRVDDIRSLTQPLRLEPDSCVPLLRGYETVCRLGDLEWQAIPLLMRSQWLQIRLRGSRKIRREERLVFVLEGFFDFIRWLDEQAESVLSQVRDALARP